MQLLTEQDIDITAFAGVRERIYIHDARQFGHQRRAESANGVGSCVYLADASIRPNRSTGRHHHREIDIVTLILNGELLHHGSLADAHLLGRGDAMIQRAGTQGFSHDEINPGERFNRFLQFWFKPLHNQNAATFAQLSVADEGMTTLYRSHDESDNNHPITRLRSLSTHVPQTLQLSGPLQLFVLKGGIKVRSSSLPSQTLSSGLLTADAAQLEVASDSMLLIIDIISNCGRPST